ncbi:MAG: NAD kinase [Actinobacteria bacterium]|nr:NAD kinase [Actinomycetota bacterium]
MNSATNPVTNPVPAPAAPPAAPTAADLATTSRSAHTSSAPSLARRVLLVAHTGRPDIGRVVEHVRDRLADGGIDLVAAGPEAAELGLPYLPPGAPESASPGASPRTPLHASDGLGQRDGRAPDTAQGRPANSAADSPATSAANSADGFLGDDARAELVLTLGGDGTLLRGAEEARIAGVPVLGINLGRVGFLTEMDADHVDLALDAVIRRNYRISERLTVDMQVESNGSIVASGWALNEVSIEKASRERILDVIVEVDGRGVSSFGCDGVLCATPTGSTAYAFSAGGPILWPTVAALLVVPSNAHALFARPLVVGAKSTVTVHVDPGGHEAVLACDGRRIAEIPPGSRVHMNAGAEPVRLVRLTDEPFTDRLVRKFSLPVHGWRDRRH